MGSSNPWRRHSAPGGQHWWSYTGDDGLPVAVVVPLENGRWLCTESRWGTTGESPTLAMRHMRNDAGIPPCPDDIQGRRWVRRSTALGTVAALLPSDEEDHDGALWVGSVPMCPRRARRSASRRCADLGLNDTVPDIPHAVAQVMRGVDRG